MLLNILKTPKDLQRIAFLNLDSVSRLRTERLRLFHSLTVAETKESLVKDSLQNGTIISLSFRRG
jgi:hypothetical protein